MDQRGMGSVAAVGGWGCSGLVTLLRVRQLRVGMSSGLGGVDEAALTKASYQVARITDL